MGKSRHWIILALVLAIVLVLSAVVWFTMFRTESGATSVWQPIALTSQNLPGYLEQFRPVQELPDESSIALTVGENSYAIQRGSVHEGEAVNPDLEISLPSDYLDIMGEHGWCTALHTAQSRGDLHVVFHGSESELAWKYRALFKYRNCLG